MSSSKHLDDTTFGFSTRAAHAGAPSAVGSPTGILVPFSSSWVLPESGDGGLEEDYGRVGTHLMSRLENQVRSLEEAKYATVFSSGIAALNSVVHTLEQNSLIIADTVTYGCTVRLLKVWERFGIKTHYLDLRQKNNISKIAELKPSLVMIESPTNPLLTILDIKQIAEATHSVGGRLSVDNSFASPFNQKPLMFGADYSVTSLTKYHNGHSTGFVGSVCTNDYALSEKMYFHRKAVGLQPGTMECAFTIQGTQTLGIRMERCAQTAYRFAETLEKHPRVRSVTYPFLPSHPQYELAKKQMKTGSGMVVVDFDIAENAIDEFINKLSPLFVRAHSLGSVKSQVSVPAKMSHASVPREHRLKAGITDGLTRFSIGIEDAEDLINWVEHALALS